MTHTHGASDAWRGRRGSRRTVRPAACPRSLVPMRIETGLGVLHLFCKATATVDREAVGAALKGVQSADGQVVTAAMLGHKCDIAVMALHPDWSVLRALQTGLQAAGLDVVDSYVSITEVSEYAKGMPEHMLNERLYPSLPPAVVVPGVAHWPEPRTSPGGTGPGAAAAGSISQARCLANRSDSSACCGTST